MIAREHFQTEQGCFRRKPGYRGWTVLPAQREVVKVKFGYVSLNGESIQSGRSGLLGEIPSFDEALVEDDPVKIRGSWRHAKRLSRH